ncbi:DUF3800 domain-containing protein [Salinarimonas sp.]|uniref:DUF3800 domain-containing protein n=1 Tax=Salinarimonas sp. TaxID=2766526 RepID=UPI003919BFE4
MIFAYLDEFGHIGPWYGADHPKHNTSPVFGVAGILLPEQAVRGFSGHFLNRKTDLLDFEIRRADKQPYEWEKKGANLFTARSILKYPNIRSTAFRIINHVEACGGRIFYYGREKWSQTEDVNPNGLYKTIFANSIRRIDRFCNRINQNFVVVIDQHAARPILLRSATQTMFGNAPAMRLASPPFEVESHLNQNIQAADWIAAIVGRIWSFRFAPQDFAHLQPYETYFWSRLHRLTVQSTVERATRRKPPERGPQVGTLGEALIAAGLSPNAAPPKPR